MKSFVDFLLNENTELNESSMIRFLSKFKNHDAVIITAFRGGVIKRNASGNPVKNKSGKNKGQWVFTKFFTKKENQQRNKELFSALSVKGYSITKVKGSYIENYTDETQRAEKYEESFVVVNHNDDKDFIKVCVNLAKTFDQDSILIIPQSNDTPKAYLLGTNDTGYPGLGVEVSFKNFGVNKLDVEFFTRLGGSKLYFLESVDKIYEKSLTSLGRMGMKGLGNKFLMISENVDNKELKSYNKKLYYFLNDVYHEDKFDSGIDDDYFDWRIDEFMKETFGNDYKFNDTAVSFYELYGRKLKYHFEQEYENYLSTFENEV